MIHHLLGSGADLGAVVEVPVVVLGEVALRTAFARVLGSVSSFRIYSVSGGTTRVCDGLTVSPSVVLRVVPEQRWFGFCFAFGRRTFSDYRGYLQFVLIVS